MTVPEKNATPTMTHATPENPGGVSSFPSNFAISPCSPPIKRAYAIPHVTNVIKMVLIEPRVKNSPRERYAAAICVPLPYVMYSIYLAPSPLALARRSLARFRIISVNSKLFLTIAN